MGREIRRVPPGWQHPKKEVLDRLTNRAVEVYKPLKDRDFDTAMKRWLDDFAEYVQKNGDGDENFKPEAPFASFAAWDGPPPNPEYYRPYWKEGEATWIQMYETVSEGTPVSPPFATPEELVEYLVQNGDYWDQKRRSEGRIGNMNCDPWTREQAESFVKKGHAFSLAVVETTKGNLLLEPRNMNLLDPKKPANSPER